MDLFIDINLPGHKIKPVAGDGLCMVNLFLEALTCNWKSNNKKRCNFTITKRTA